MKTTLPESISTKEEAIAFLTALHKNNEDYHPDDDAHEIIAIKDGEPIFTTEEADKLNGLMNQIFYLHWNDTDPYSILNILNAMEGANEPKLSDDMIGGHIRHHENYTYTVEKNPHTKDWELAISDGEGVLTYNYGRNKKAIAGDIEKLRSYGIEIDEE